MKPSSGFTISIPLEEKIENVMCNRTGCGYYFRTPSIFSLVKINLDLSGWSIQVLPPSVDFFTEVSDGVRLEPLADTVTVTLYCAGSCI